MLECALIRHGSPTLAHLKTGSLFTVPYESDAALLHEIDRINATLYPRGVMLTLLRCGGSSALLYLYREKTLSDVLRLPQTQSFLRTCGYTAFTPDEAVSRLRTRLDESPDFPHEIGVFLGYPLEDVIAFIENAGRNCLCTGCWKCYTNECEARRTFARYKKCHDVYSRCYANGFPLQRLTVPTFA